jgi:fibronectin-binding autotransporter adhesin
MWLRDDSTIVGDITPSAFSINKLHIDTDAGQTIAGVLKNFGSVTINGGGTLVTAWKDAALNTPAFNSTLTLPAGTNTVTFTAANTYTGATDVKAGKLALIGAGSIGQSAVITISAGAQLDVAGVTLPFTLNAPQTLTNNGTVAGSVDVLGTIGGSGIFTAGVMLENGGHLSPGSSPGTLTFMSGLTLGHGSVVDFDLGSSSDVVRISGGVFDGSDTAGTTVNFHFGPGFVAGAYTLFDWSGASAVDVEASDFVSSGAAASFAVVGNTLQVSVVPEPSTAVAAILLLGLAAHGRAPRSRAD